MKKTWNVSYDHKDGRKGTVKVITEVERGKGSLYGNQKHGRLTVVTSSVVYDLRYNKGNLHMAMLKNYFGSGFVNAVEI